MPQTSFDVTSLFTRVLLHDDAIQILSRNLQNRITHLIRSVLTTYFVYDGTFYEQIDGVAIGSPLAPVVANLYIETFEQQAIDMALKKPSHWFRYVHDTFVLWPH
jgi:hypothetical protein